MQAIVTKYIGPSNIRGSRIKAYCEAGSITIPYPHELSGSAVYRAAADALVQKLGWQATGELLEGGIGNGYVYVFDNPVNRAEYEYLCATCGKRGPEHGYWSVTDPRTHKFVCGEKVRKP